METLYRDCFKMKKIKLVWRRLLMTWPLMRIDYQMHRSGSFLQQHRWMKFIRTYYLRAFGRAVKIILYSICSRKEKKQLEAMRLDCVPFTQKCGCNRL